MTEAEWLAATNFQEMLIYISPIASDRKSRCFALESVSAIHSPNTQCRDAILGLNAFVKGDASVDALRVASNWAAEAMRDVTEDASEQRWYYRDECAVDAVIEAVAERVNLPVTSMKSRLAVALGVDPAAEKETARVETLRQLALLRCIFGNPFRPVAFAPSWRSETAIALAAGIYEERAFDRLPILADALEEAGCDHPDVLSHCRRPGLHARGCWVVDGVLGKE